VVTVSESPDIEEIGKAASQRDYRKEEIEELNATLSSLNATKENLKLKIKELGESANETTIALNESATTRSDEKEVNIETIAKAKEGLRAVKDAIAILKSFYKSAAKAEDYHSGKLNKVALLRYKQAEEAEESPVDADDPGAGFKGAYSGQQEASKSIFGLLEVIKSDFERTIKATTREEKRAAAEFVDFDRTSRASIASDEKGGELNEQDLESTKAKIKQKTQDLKTAQKLHDEAVQAIEDLKPTCLDSEMTFEERAAKREEEIAALKKALCYLDPAKVEADCK